MRGLKRRDKADTNTNTDTKDTNTTQYEPHQAERTVQAREYRSDSTGQDSPVDMWGACGGGGE